MITLRKYITFSMLTASAVIYHAFATRRQFFPATVYLSTSKLAVAAVGNLSFAVALCMYNLVIKVFLGTLREIELERVKEKLSSAIMETCLALTIFREEFNMGFVGMFTVLTFVKVFHWLVEDRVDYIEVTPSVSRLAHARIVSFLLVLLGLDIMFLHYTIGATLDQKGHSVQLLFAFEYIILASTAAATFLKYVLSMLDSAMEGRWDGKGTYVFYLELLKDMLHLFVYCIFFTIVFSNYGLPLHLIRDLYNTFRNFRSRITDFLRFRQVTARMDRFPDATQTDLARCDGICIICREEMAPQGLNKKLHCGHVFHLHCLRSWLERQQNCPTCRTSVFRPRPPAGADAAAAAARDAQEAAQAAPGAAGAAAGEAAAAGGGGGAAPGPVPAAAGAVAGAAAHPAVLTRPTDATAPARPTSGIGRYRLPATDGAGTSAAAAQAPVAGAAAAGGTDAQQQAGLQGVQLPPHLNPPPARRDGNVHDAARAHESAGRRGSGSLAAAGAAAASAGGSGEAADAAAAGIPAGFWPNSGGAAVPAAGLMWQMPQWYPVTSMAAFSNTPLQYAGQQSAVDQAQAQALAAASMVPMVPAIIPAISAPFSAVISQPVGMAPNATPEQAQAAAAAAMAAAAAAMYMPPMMPGLALMPPAMLPGAAPGSTQEQMAAAAAANAAAAAAAAVMGGAATPEVMQASFEATQQMLQRQLDYLQSQMNRIRSSGGSEVGAAAAPAAVPTSTAPPPPAAAAGAAAETQSTSAAAPALAAALQQQQQGADAETPVQGLVSHAEPSSPVQGLVDPGPIGTDSAGESSSKAVSQGVQAAAKQKMVEDVPVAVGDDVAGSSVEQQQGTAGAAAAVQGQGREAGELASELRRRRLQHFESDGAAGGAS